jgi:hypothetical protein
MNMDLLAIIGGIFAACFVLAVGYAIGIAMEKKD